MKGQRQEDRRGLAYCASVREICRQRKIKCLMMSEVIHMRSLFNNELRRRWLERVKQRAVDAEIRKLIESLEE